MNRHVCDGIKAGPHHFAWYCPICDEIVRVEDWRSQQNRGGAPKFFRFEPFSENGPRHSVVWCDEEAIQKIGEQLQNEQKPKQHLKIVR